MAWVRLCELDEVPPREMRSFSVQGLEVLAVRGDDAYLVIPPLCPHMATPLADGFFDGCVLTCSTHLWQWSIADAQPMGDAERPLLTYAAQTRDGAIWVDIVEELTYDHEEES